MLNRAGGSRVEDARAERDRIKGMLAAAEAELEEAVREERREQARRLREDDAALRQQLVDASPLPRVHAEAVYGWSRRWALDHNDDVRDVFQDLEKLVAAMEPPAL